MKVTLKTMDMTYQMQHTQGLPDPVRDAEFYDGVAMRRLLAWIIDAIVIIALSVVTTLVAGVMTLGIALFFASFLFMATGFIYRVATITSKSATLGMLIMGIQFRRMDGQLFELKDAFVHTTLYTILVITFFGQIASMVTMATSQMGRGLHDMVLGSTAINKPL